jgi:outer membrane protein
LSPECQPTVALHYFCYMRFYILPLILLTSISVTAQDTTNRWTLRKAVDYAVRNNLTVQQADIQRMFADVDLQQSNMTILPTLGGNVSTGWSFGLSNNPATGTLESSNFFSTQAGVQTNYTIFNWFARRNDIEANKLALAATKAGIEKAQNDISLSVANTFLQAMLNNETVRIAEVQLGQSQEQLRNTNALVRAGTVPELNSLQLQAQVATDSANLIQAQSSYRQAIIQMKALLNLPQDTAFAIIIPPVELIPLDNLSDLEPRFVYSQALTNQPLQKINELRLQQAGYQVKIARGSMYPSFFAQAGVNTSYVNSNTIPAAFKTPFFKQLNNNFGQNLGVGVSFNIFNQYQARSQWNRSKIQVQQYQLQQQQDNAALQSDIFNAYELAVAALQKYNASVRQVDVSQQALDLANKRYELGLLNVLDLIITQNNLQRARIEMVRNRYDYVFKMKVLEFYKGNGIRL